MTQEDAGRFVYKAELLRKQESQRTFDQKAHEFDSNPVLLACVDAAAKALRANGVLQPGQEVLDFGCGTGLLALALADGCAAVLGVDSSQGMVQVLQHKIDAHGPGCNVRAACCELQSPSSLHAANDPADPFPERFDLIVSSLTFHHIENIPDVLQLLVGHLKPGGRVAVFDYKKSDVSSQFHPAAMAHTVFHPAGFAPEELCAFFSGAGLADVSCRKVGAFCKPRGDDPHQQMAYELLMALGTKH